MGVGIRTWASVCRALSFRLAVCITLRLAYLLLPSILLCGSGGSTGQAQREETHRSQYTSIPKPAPVVWARPLGVTTDSRIQVTESYISPSSSTSGYVDEPVNFKQLLAVYLAAGSTWPETSSGTSTVWARRTSATSRTTSWSSSEHSA